MARFLNTSATNFFLEEMVKNAKERLIFISPYLKLNDRLKELLEDKNRLKIDIRIVYGKSDLRPAEAEWLADLSFVRTSFCKNLHAKCYINEEQCIVTSLNLYEFSQINNNEMGILVDKSNDQELYRDAYDEALRIIRISDEDITLIESETTPKNSAEKLEACGSTTSKVKNASKRSNPQTKAQAKNKNTSEYEKLTIPRIAKARSLSKEEVIDRLENKGFIKRIDDKILVTGLGINSGGEIRSGRHGEYTLWPQDIEI